MKNLLTLLALLAAMCLPAPAFAGGGIGLGSLTLSDYCDDVRERYTVITCDESAPAARLFFGGKVNEHWAIEGGITVGGEMETAILSSGTIYIQKQRTAGLDLAAIGIVPLSEQFNVSGRLGFMVNSLPTADTFTSRLRELLASGTSSGEGTADWDTYFLGGVGIHYVFHHIEETDNNISAGVDIMSAAGGASIVMANLRVGF